VKTGTPEMGEFGMIDPIVMYDNLMNNFEWGNAADPSVYLDENNKRMFSNFRRLFGNLGKALLESGDTTKAIAVAHRGLEIVPAEKLANDYFSLATAEVLIRAGKKDEGERLINEIISYASDYLNFIIAVPSKKQFGLEYLKGINIQALIDIYRMGVRLKMTDLVKKLEPELNRFYSTLYSGTK
jgi:tetratricopeptide (TPR) repeat protein